MTRFSVILAIGAFCVSIAYSMASDDAIEKIVIGENKESTIHLGKLSPRETVRKEVLLVNERPTSFNPVSLKTDCGCTEAGLEFSPIPPKGTRVMNVSLHARKELGEISGNIVVLGKENESDEEFKPLHVFHLVGTVDAMLLATPDSIGLGCVLTSDLPLQRKLNLKVSPDRAFGKDILAHSPEDYIKADVQPSDKDPQAGTATVTVGENTPWGEFYGFVVFSSESRGGKLLTVKVAGKLAGDISASPGALFLGGQKTDLKELGIDILGDPKGEISWETTPKVLGDLIKIEALDAKRLKIACIDSQLKSDKWFVTHGAILIRWTGEKRALSIPVYLNY